MRMVRFDGCLHTETERVKIKGVMVLGEACDSTAKLRLQIKGIYSRIPPSEINSAGDVSSAPNQRLAEDSRARFELQGEVDYTGHEFM